MQNVAWSDTREFKFYWFNSLMTPASMNLQPLAVIFLVKCFELLVLRSEPTTRGSIDNEQHLASVVLTDRSSLVSSYSFCC